MLWVAKHSSGPVGFGDGTVKSFDQLIKWINDCDFIVAHHAKFELQWLYRYGVEPGSVLCFDTMLGEKVLAGNRRWDFDLDSVASRYGLENKEAIVKAMIQGGVCPSEIPPQRLNDYCRQDVAITDEIFLKQRPLLDALGLFPTCFTRNLACMVLSDIEANGMALDEKLVEEEYRKTLNESRAVLAELHELTGGINPNSPKQTGEFLYDTLGFAELKDYRGNVLRTDTGLRRTGDEVVSQLKPTTKPQREFLDAFTRYVPVKKRLETLTKFHQCAESGDVLKFNFNQHITVTHRLSCNGKKYKVQGQNIDRTLKRLFRARKEGWLVGDIDYAQLEFRAGGHLGKDTQIKKDIRSKWDVHRHTAAVILKKKHADVTKEERTNYKPRTFAPMFFSTSGTPDERRYNEEFRKRYHELNSTQKEWTYEVLAKKELKTETGLKFYWPECKLTRNNYITYSTEISNCPIQSFCGAEIVPVALIYFWYRLKAANAQSFLVNTVHDSVTGEVAPEEQELWEDLVKVSFLDDVFKYLKAVYGIRFSVPLAIAYSVDEHWAQGEDKEIEGTI